MINGVKVPDISIKPYMGESCYIPFPTSKILYGHHVYHTGNETDSHLSDNNLCYPYTEEGKQAAILHTKAMLNMSLSQ
jgi:hypothetical protein